MSKHKAHVAITHMLNYAKEAIALAQNRSRIDLDILWAILTEDLHPLIAKLEHILAEGIE